MSFLTYLVILLAAAKRLDADLITKNKETYRAAVVEFPLRLSPSTNLVDQTRSNVGLHSQIMREQLKGRAVDVLVFPEAVLNFKQTAIRVPRPIDKKIACDDPKESSVLRELSCAVQEVAAYVVVHLYIERNCSEERLETNDVRPCTDPARDINIYNAAVVFNRDGALIAVYRKFNMAGETDLQTTLVPDKTVFETDFGIKFGVFICFDIQFKSPAIDLVESGIKHFVYPTLWFSELPYLTALQTQNMWAHGNNVVLLAAGGNRPEFSNTGSGIFNGASGAIHSIISDRQQLKTIIADVPFNMSNSDALQLNGFNEKSGTKSVKALPGLEIWQQNLSEFNVKFLDFERNAIESGEIVHNGVLCKFNISVIDTHPEKNHVHYSYAVAAFDGLRKYVGSRSQTAIQICSVISCGRPGSVESCAVRLPIGKPTQERYIFHKLNLVAEILGEKKSFVMPNTLTRQLKSIESKKFQFAVREFDDAQMAELELSTPMDDIQTFAIYARDFRSDVNAALAADALLKTELRR